MTPTRKQQIGAFALIYGLSVLALLAATATLDLLLRIAR